MPNTKLKVQGWIAEEPPDRDIFVPVPCTACITVHYINQFTGKVLGEDARANEVLSSDFSFLCCLDLVAVRAVKDPQLGKSAKPRDRADQLHGPMAPRTDRK